MYLISGCKQSQHVASLRWYYYLDLEYQVVRELNIFRIDEISDDCITHWYTSNNEDIGTDKKHTQHKIHLDVRILYHNQ